MKEKIIILEDKDFIAERYAEILRGEQYNVRTAGNSDDFFAVQKEFDADLILLDIELTGSRMNGLEVFRTLKKQNDFSAQVIVVSGEASRQEVAESMKLGAYSFIEKTGAFDTKKFLLDIHHALFIKKQKEHLLALEEENKRLRLKATESSPLIGSSEAMKEIRHLIERLANVDVLLIGETGTGKEVVAQHIRHLSKRFDKPFISVNCAAIAETLVESELFGHKKGSFTGADKDKTGAFEKADGGILFLDEIDSLSLRNQGVILKAIEHKEIQPVGGTAKTVDIQLICATNKNLHELVRQKQFRQDLYFRLQGSEIRIPPLRERGHDIPELMNYFLEKKSQRRTDDVIIELDLSAIQDILFQYEWPGNVRELERFCEKMINQYPVITNDVIQKEMKLKMSPPSSDNDDDNTGLSELFRMGNWKESMDEFEKEFLLFHLRRNRWKVDKTAEAIGLDKTTLYKKIRKYQLEEF